MKIINVQKIMDELGSAKKSLDELIHCKAGT